MQVVATDLYLAIEYGKADFPPDTFGFSRTQRLEFAGANFRYVRAAQPIEALASQRLDKTLLYNERELKHMQDVQATYQAAMWVWQIALLTIALSAVTLAWRAATRASLAAALKWGGLLTVGLVGGLGLLAVVAWQFWFIAFHQIFFVPGTWMFNEWDTLIRLFPNKFWFDAALTIVGLSVISGGLLMFVGWRWSSEQRATKSSLLTSPNPS